MTACSLHRRRSIAFLFHGRLRSGLAAPLLLFLAFAAPVAADANDFIYSFRPALDITAQIVDEAMGLIRQYCRKRK